MSGEQRPCGSCGATPTYMITLDGRPVPACLRHLNHWRTPASDYTCPTACVETNHPGREHRDWLTGHSPAEATTICGSTGLVYCMACGYLLSSDRKGRTRRADQPCVPVPVRPRTPTDNRRPEAGAVSPLLLVAAWVALWVAGCAWAVMGRG